MASPEPHRRIVFCDFDGTITAEETFVGMLKQFATLDYNDYGRRLAEGRHRFMEQFAAQFELEWVGKA